MGATYLVTFDRSERSEGLRAQAKKREGGREARTMSTYGFPQSDWDRAKQEAREAMIEVARVTYGELGGAKHPGH
jgi:hypothetical protein